MPAHRERLGVIEWRPLICESRKHQAKNTQECGSWHGRISCPFLGYVVRLCLVSEVNSLEVQQALSRLTFRRGRFDWISIARNGLAKGTIRRLAPDTDLLHGGDLDQLFLRLTGGRVNRSEGLGYSLVGMNAHSQQFQDAPILWTGGTVSKPQRGASTYVWQGIARVGTIPYNQKFNLPVLGWNRRGCMLHRG